MSELLRWGLLCLMCAGCASSHRQLSSGALARVEKAAADYSHNQAPTDDPEAAALRAMFEGAMAPHMRARIRHDPRLDVVALVELEQFAATGKAVSNASAQWVVWRAGFAGRYLHARVWRAGNKRKNLDEQLKLEALAFEISVGKEAAPLSYGLARADSSAGTHGQAVVIATWPIELRAAPRHVTAGATFKLAGNVRLPTKALRVAWADKDGKRTHVDVPLGGDGAFDVEVTAPTTPGRVFFLLSGRDPFVDLGMIPIFVGAVEAPEPDPVLDAAGHTALLRDQLEALRTADGRPALISDPALDAFASRLAEGVCKGGKKLDDHQAWTAELALAGYQAPITTTTTRNAGDLFVLDKLESGYDSAARIAIATCEIERGGKEGQQYVLILAADPK